MLSPLSCPSIQQCTVLMPATLTRHEDNSQNMLPVRPCLICQRIHRLVYRHLDVNMYRPSFSLSSLAASRGSYSLQPFHFDFSVSGTGPRYFSNSLPAIHLFDLFVYLLTPSFCESHWQSTEVWTEVFLLPAPSAWNGLPILPPLIPNLKLILPLMTTALWPCPNHECI